MASRRLPPLAWALAGAFASEPEVVNLVLDQDTGKLLKYRQLLSHPKLKEDWNLSSANEFGQLAQGIGGRVEGTNTIFFIHKSEVPEDRFKDCTYGKFECTV